MLLKPQVFGEQVLHHVGRLGALVDGEALLARSPVRKNSARLVGDAGVAAEPEGRLDDLVRRRKAAVGVACLVAALEAEIVAQARVDDRRCRIKRRLWVGDGRQFLVLDGDERERVFRFGARARHHCRHCLALPARATSTAMACCG